MTGCFITSYCRADQRISTGSTQRIVGKGNA
jgi:hypothetical protein